ncbi:MAG: trypsin-like peptidase domain-containing protein [Steroidobacter sp.]
MADCKMDSRGTIRFFAGLAFVFANVMWAHAGAETANAKNTQEVISNAVENAVVKVFSTMRYPDTTRPWTRQEPSEVTGSGVVIDGNRILTNAHVVMYASQVQVQANQDGDKILATVESVAPEIDLAVLKLDDESFFKTHPALPRANKLPSIKDNVLVYGFPMGGNSLSITKGIVSRIEFVAYNFPVGGLRIQIDAAINPGNSGGPAVVDGRMIGLAFSVLNNSQNIGYIISNEEIELFLKDVADGHYDGKPAMFDDLQTLENASLRSFLKLDPSVHGAIVHHPYTVESSSPLKEWDVITRIGDTAVDDQGMILINSNVRVNFGYRIQQIAKNGKVPLTIVREGKQMTIDMPVSNSRPYMIPDLRGTYPPYFIYGSLVFSKASRQFMGGIGKSQNYYFFFSGPLIKLFAEPPSADRDELVVISSPLFPHKVSKGYDSPQFSVVSAVNGTAVRSLKHLVAILRDLQDEYVIFQLEPQSVPALVFNRKEMLAATEDILTDNGIRSQG